VTLRASRIGQRAMRFLKPLDSVEKLLLCIILLLIVILFALAALTNYLGSLP
jgi:hypothetical protein